VASVVGNLYIFRCPLNAVLLRKEYCSIQEIRWFSLLNGSRTEAATSAETARRKAEAKKLLPHLFGVPYEQCLKALVDNEEAASYLLDNVDI